MTCIHFLQDRCDFRRFPGPRHEKAHGFRKKKEKSQGTRSPAQCRRRKKSACQPRKVISAASSNPPDRAPMAKPQAMRQSCGHECETVQTHLQSQRSGAGRRPVQIPQQDAISRSCSTVCAKAVKNVSTPNIRQTRSSLSGGQKHRRAVPAISNPDPYQMRQKRRRIPVPWRDVPGWRARPARHRPSPACQSRPGTGPFRTGSRFSAERRRNAVIRSVRRH